MPARNVYIFRSGGIVVCGYSEKLSFVLLLSTALLNGYSSTTNSFMYRNDRSPFDIFRHNAHSTADSRSSKVEQLLLRKSIFLEIITEVVFGQLNNLMKKTETY